MQGITVMLGGKPPKAGEMKAAEKASDSDVDALGLDATRALLDAIKADDAKAAYSALQDICEACCLPPADAE